MEQLRTLLNTPAPPASPLRGFALLLVSLIAFVIWFSDNQLQTVAVIVGVLFVHELGHYVGMRAFGYRDVKMFFIPFFGAAVSGRNETAPTWQQATVLLLGPFPGIVAGLTLFALTQPVEGTPLRELATVLVLLNAFNLLPLTPLDGGRLLEVLLFSRHAILSAAFRLLAVGGLVLFALWTGGTFFWILAVLIFITIPAEFRQTASVAAFRRSHPNLATDPARLTDEQLLELLGMAQRSLPAPMPPEKYAEQVRALHGRAISPPATLSQTVLFLAVYAMGIFATIVFLFLTAPD